MESINFTSKYNTLDKVVNKLFGSYYEKQYYKSFFDDIKYPPSNKGRILMYVGIGHMYLTPMEIIVYHMLKKKGYEVDYLIYDEKIPINEIITKEQIEKQGKDKFWNKSVKNAKKVLGATNVSYEFIKEIPVVSIVMDRAGETVQELLNFEYNGVPFGEIVEGVMFRYYKSLTFGEDALEVAKRFMKTALTNYFFLEKKVSENRYSYVMFSHGIYCTWQPVVEYCVKKSIPFICYDRAKTKAHANFCLNSPSPAWDINESWERLKEYELNNKELSMVENYLRERELQKGDVYAYNFAEKEKDIHNLRKKLNIKDGAKVITIFTNLIWDAANVARDVAFKSPLDCILKTINHFKDKKEVHILIRTHPAEYLLGTRESYSDLIKNAFEVLPENVTIISPELKVNSFSVLELSDVGVVHTSTVGLEMAIEGKPTILISETHYRNKGFTFDATSPDHYFNLLGNLLNGDLKIHEQVKLAKKYFYLMMFEYQHKMPMTFSEIGVFNGFGYKNFNDLYGKKEDPICKIIDRLVGVEPFNDFIFR